MPVHPNFFLCDNGDLVRAKGPYKLVREGYAYTHRDTITGAELRATLRAGERAWPGGYPAYLVMSDGEAMHFKCARDNLKEIIRAIRDKAHNGWRVIGCDINWEDTSMYCCHCNERIESAYGGEE